MADHNQVHATTPKGPKGLVEGQQAAEAETKGYATEITPEE